jgi:DNA processing protein
MDKGMDIDFMTCVLALHAVLFLNPQRLAEGASLLHRRTADGASPAKLKQTTEAYARGARVAPPDWRAAEAALAWAGPQRTLLTLLHAEYPPLLRNISTIPPVLFIEGHLSQLVSPQISVIGSRNSTATGCELAYKLSAELAAEHFVITSGMARGIDSAAHRGALESGGGTVAVFGCGIDQIYPRQNASLAAEISQRGVLVSEFPLGTPPMAHHFPLRNRIISGLAVGTVVVEASLRSGSLITAQCALEQGREVFAVPGSVSNPMTRGCHALIKQGATLVESAADILAELPRHTQPRPARKPLIPKEIDAVDSELALDPDFDAVLTALGYEPVSIDALLQRTGLTHKILSSILLTLELAGRVRSLEGGYYECPASPRRCSP